MVADISHGEENVPIPVINEVDSEVPDPFQYIVQYDYSDEKVQQFVEEAEGKERMFGRPELQQCSKPIAELFSTGKAFYTSGNLYELLFEGVYECVGRCQGDGACHQA